MKLQALPLLMEGFHQVHLDAGYQGGVNRWAEIPEEWIEEFLAAERALGRITGTMFQWEGGEHTGAEMMYMGCEGPDLMHMISVAEFNCINGVLGDFFDGDADSRHQRMISLFVTKEYQR